MRTFAVFVVWALLLYRVSETVLSEGYFTTADLTVLALLAWLGGLLANELIRYIIDRYRRTYGD